MIKKVIESCTGKSVVSLPEYEDLWLEWYKGDVQKFHHYEMYNGDKTIQCQRKTLNMPKKISEDWANLLLNEKTDVVAGDATQQKKLWELLNKVNFWQKGNEGIEKTFALGNGAFVEGYDDKGNVRLQFVNAKKIYPITIEQDKVTECAFVNVNSRTTIIQIHIRGRIVQDAKGTLFIPDDKGNYHIRTLVYEKKINDRSKSLGELISDSIEDTKSQRAWFQLLKPNIANNIDINSPMGISIFANALDNLEGVDLAYDGFCEEMRLCKARIFIDSKLTRYDATGEHKVFDNRDVGFYVYGDGEGKQPLTVYNPTLRTSEYFAGINNALNLLSSKVGFGENHYRFDKGGVTTATQVISENSEMFRTLKKHEILINDVIIDVCKALMYIHNEFSGDSFKFNLEDNLEVKFDDSIIEDKETQKMADRQDVNMNVMSKVDYRMKWYNEDEETAKKKIAEIEEATRNNSSAWFSE